MNTAQLECFVAVANYLNFARAAEELHITQPAVTHQINALEAELTVKLFSRTTRQVSLTQDGRMFLPDAESILQATRLAKSRFAGDSDESFSSFSVGCHGTSELMMLPDILRAFSERFPRIHPFLKTVPFHSLANLLENGTIDVMFDFENERLLKKDYAYCELLHTRVMCAMSSAHPLSGQPVLKKEDLLSHKMILQEPFRISPALFELQKPMADSHAPKDLYFCESTEAALTLAKAGLGLTMVFDIMPLRETSLLYIPLENAPTLSYGIYHKRRDRSEETKCFLSLCKKAFLTPGTETVGKIVPS